MLHILMSTYNGERYLSEQIDSILAQTYTEWRLHIRDDGSRDGTKAILKTYAMGDNSPAEVLEKTNNDICSNNIMEMFVTVWLGILEISTGKLTAANAGHEYQVLGHIQSSKR